MLSDIVSDQGELTLLGDSTDGAPSSAKTYKRKVTEQRAVLHQRILEEYWRRRVNDDEDVQWARNLIARRPRESAISGSDTGTSLTAPVPKAELASLDFSPLATLEKQNNHQTIDFSPPRSPALRVAESTGNVTWLKCIDNAEIELLKAPQDDFVSVNNPDAESVDELVEGVLRNLESLIEDVVASCVASGYSAFSTQNVEAVQVAAQELSGLHCLRMRFQNAMSSWRDGRDYVLDKDEAEAELPELPGLADTITYLTLRISGLDATICEALMNHKYDTVETLARSGAKLHKLYKLILCLVSGPDLYPRSGR